jgi:hypothetical protein
MGISNIFSSNEQPQKTRYRQENNYYCVDITLTNILQLFDRIDPSPFREKDLDDDFVKYLSNCMHELHYADNVKLVIKMQEHIPQYYNKRDIEDAIHNYFSFEIENSRHEIKKLFQQGRWALGTGIIFLILCHIAVFLLSENFSGVIMNAIKEGITVMGWVALWWPTNIFLYEWLPFYNRIKLFERLKKIKVEIIIG